MNPTRTTVLFVSLGVAYGGAETYYVKLARILLAEFNVVAVVCCPRLADEFRSLGMEVYCGGEDLTTVARYTSSLRGCWRMVQRHKVSVANLNGQPETYLALFLRLMGVRVTTCRHTPFTDRYMREGSRVPVFLKTWLVLLSLRLARLTICDSQLLVRQLAEHLSPSRLLFVPTWVEDPFLAPYPRSVTSTPLRALFLGRVVRNKGIFDVIEAMRQCEGIHLTIVGEGVEMAKAQQLAEGLPIVFAGFRSDTQAAYRAADLLIFASPEGFEGLPQVPLEGMAMGVPCLASDISSVLEIAETAPGEPPPLALYKQGDAADLARQLMALAGDPNRLAQLGRAGRLQVERRFTVAAVSEPFLNAFRAASEST